MKLHFRTIRTVFFSFLIAFVVMPAMAQHDEDGTSLIIVEDAGGIALTDETADSDTLDADTVVAAPAPVDLPWPQNIQAGIDKLLDGKLFKSTQVGLMVWDLDADSVIYSHNEKFRLRPASTQKMVTAVAALDYLGTNYEFRTELRYRGTVVDSTRTLYGDIYCIGGMDPMFNSKDLKMFVDSIRALGIDTIRGNLYADLSFKDKDRLGSGWCWDDDNPVLSPLLLNRKDYFREQLLRSLSERGIVLTGTTAIHTPPAGTTILLCSRERHINEILRPMMKRSDNLYAEAMFYQIAHKMGGRYATAKMARQRIDATIRKAGISDKDSHSADGSGLSLYNYETPEIELMLLRYAYRNSDIYRLLYYSMPIAGVDGTLRKRMKGTAAYNNVHAKTGTVTGVSALAGYCTAKNGHRLCFSIINQGIRNSREGRNFQDQVCAILCR